MNPLLKDFFRRFRYYLAYYRCPPWDTGESPPELLGFIKSSSPGKALDLGCGTGTNVITLAKHGWKVTGVDYIPKAVFKAQKKCTQLGIDVNLIVDDVVQLQQIQGTFDLILDIGCYHSIPRYHIQAYANNINRFLDIKGTYLLYGFTTAENSNVFLSNQHLNAISEFLNLENRIDSYDRELHSAWFYYKKSLIL